MIPPSHGFFACAAKVLKNIRAARAPLLVAIVAGFVLANPPQTREIYRATAEDISGNVFQLILSLLILCAVSISFALITRELLREFSVPRGPQRIRAALPIVIASLIPLGLSMGLYLAAREAQIGTPPVESLTKMPELEGLLMNLRFARATLYGGALVCAMIATSLLIPNFGFRSLRIRKFFGRRRLHIRHFSIFGAACLIFFSVFPIRGSQLVGPIGIILLAVMGIGSVTASLTKIGDRLQLPVLSGIVSLAFLMSVLDWTDNHTVELNDSSAPRLERAVDAFEKWYLKREDRKWFESRNTPYPVFVVGASGGGLYAAHHAATVLSRLQDQCPNFSQHIFAISGVSGGSLGGALFSSIAKKQAVNQDHVECTVEPSSKAEGPFEKQINRFMETDFLSPALAAALFPDAVQRLFPAFTSRFDRARAFESTLGQAWKTLYPTEEENVWSKPFLDHWNVGSAAPALILNSTNVEHGNRVAITPFGIIDMGELGNIVPLSNLAEFHKLTELRSGDSSTARRRDTSLATAVSLSARFPWVMPAGRLMLQNGPIAGCLPI